jgi:hypothetical protein
MRCYYNIIEATGFELNPENVGFLTSFLSRFARPHPNTPDFRKTDDNSVRKTAFRKTPEFLTRGPLGATALLVAIS